MSDSSDSEFKRLVGNVKPIKNDRVNLHAERSKNSMTTRTLPPLTDHGTTLDRQSDQLLAAEAYFDAGLQRKMKARIRSGAIQIDDRIDLHGLRGAEAAKALSDFLILATARQYRMLLVIHGQGYGSEQQAVLKPMVQRHLAQRKDILAWCPAQPQDGAGGATYVYLKKI